MRFQTMWYVPPAKAQTRLRIRVFASRLNILSLKGGCTGSSESRLVKMPHCRKSHVTAHISFKNKLDIEVVDLVSFCCFTNKSEIGAQWLNGRVLDSRPRGRGFKPHRHHCRVLEEDTFILA